MAELGAAHFNAAIEALEKGEEAKALHHAATACTLDPADAEAEELLQTILDRTSSTRAPIAGGTEAKSSTTPARTRRRSGWAAIAVLALAGAFALGRWIPGDRSATVVDDEGAALPTPIASSTVPPSPVESPAPSPTEETQKPAAAAAVETPPPPVSTFEILVLPGDTYSKLAARVFGDAQAWRAIARANPEYPDPARLPAGVWLTVEVDRASPRAASGD
jgi:hypothetical protein